jgi:hypothetical protein
MICITLARKPLEGTTAQNVLQYETGGINIDACRVGCEAISAHSYPGYDKYSALKDKETESKGDPVYHEHQGRWPANLILQHAAGCYCTGTKRVNANQSSKVGSGGHSGSQYFGQVKVGTVRQSTADSEGMETVSDWICVEGCPIKALDRQSGISISSGGRTIKRSGGGNVGSGKSSEKLVLFEDPGFGDTGGSSRFFQQVQHENAQLNFLRANGDMLCPLCGNPYRNHPEDGKASYLNVLCNGTRVKL